MRLDFLKRFEFFTGVPDSQLKPLCNYLLDNYGISDRHIVAANEGNAVALAAGHYLATGKVPVVYLQNSGLGNIVNPVSSLLQKKVYGIPCLFVVGWRGEPGVHDEPQHIFQGEKTLELLDLLEIQSYVVNKETSQDELEKRLADFEELFENGRQAALVIQKGTFEYAQKEQKGGSNQGMKREDIISHILEVTREGDIFVSTTGKTSRELYELREMRHEDHKKDFLTVGSMGHSSSIALGVALEKKGRRVWCFDGDGAVLMHMGSLALIGAFGPKNFIHVVINNGAHESVGGMPTVAGFMDWLQIAKGCRYRHVMQVETFEQLDTALASIKEEDGPHFLEVKSIMGSRKDLGRPKESPQENKSAFMAYLSDEHLFSVKGFGK